MTHSLFSQEKDMPIAFFEKFNKQDIKETIIEHLSENPTDTLELCKEYSKRDIKRFYGSEIIAFYEINPKNNKPSLVFKRGSKNCFKSLNN
jgi:DNA polymerase III delta subunit